MLPFVLEQDYGCVANESPEGERGADESPTSDAQSLTTQRRRKCASLDRVEPLDNGSYEVKTLHFSPEKTQVHFSIFRKFLLQLFSPPI